MATVFLPPVMVAKRAFHRKRLAGSEDKTSIMSCLEILRGDWKVGKLLSHGPSLPYAKVGSIQLFRYKCDLEWSARKKSALGLHALHKRPVERVEGYSRDATLPASIFQGYIRSF